MMRYYEMEYKNRVGCPQKDGDRQSGSWNLNMLLEISTFMDH